MSDTNNNNSSNSTPTPQANQTTQTPATNIPERTTIVSVIMQVKNGAQEGGKTKDMK